MKEPEDIGLKEGTENAVGQRVFLERLGLYYASLPVSILAIVANTLLVGYLLKTQDNASAIAYWVGATLLIAVYRVSQILRFRRQTLAAHERHASAWYREMLLGAGLSGATWGLAGFLFFNPLDPLNVSVLSFVIAGMCAGSIVSMSAFYEAVALFVTLSLLPFLTRLLLGHSETMSIMAVMVAIYLIIVVIFARRLNATVVNGLEMAHLRSRAELTIEKQAMFDELTGLPNRRLLQDRLSQALARARRNDTQAALLFLDLDFFKRVNDSLGHSAGDQLLIVIARRIKSLLREEDTAARLGGDEFVALLPDIGGDSANVVTAVRRLGEKLRQAIERPVELDGTQVHITASIGASLLPADTDNTEDLLAHADTAMYRAKEDGRNTLRFFVPDMQAMLAQRMGIESRLRAALDANEGLALYLQPQYDREQRICGAELLLRWRHEGEFIGPDVFIPVAEDSGLIYRLGDWVVEEACRIGAALLPLLDDRPFSLAFNVSPRQFRQAGFANKVLQVVAQRALPNGLMELELTEGLLVEDVENTAETMQALRESGLRFSIDDFGTGYSSLRYLKSLPLDSLKIDQSFVRDVLTDPSDASIVRAIVSVAESLELDVIAEGVETQAIHDFLSSAGCPKFQGYLYARPMPLEDFEKLL